MRIGLRGIRLDVKPASAQATQEERRAARRELFVSLHFWIICIFNIAFSYLPMGHKRLAAGLPD